LADSILTLLREEWKCLCGSQALPSDFLIAHNALSGSLQQHRKTQQSSVTTFQADEEHKKLVQYLITNEHRRFSASSKIHIIHCCIPNHSCGSNLAPLRQVFEYERFERTGLTIKNVDLAFYGEAIRRQIQQLLKPLNILTVQQIADVFNAECTI
jgi:hypothetical protein